MQFNQSFIAGVGTIDLEPRHDGRGFFVRAYCSREFAQFGLASSVVQVNHSLSKQQGTLRGLHYQLAPHAETKIVRCLRGAIWDCVLDIRDDSPTFGQWFAAELTAENMRMMCVPNGCAHGFLTLSPEAEVMYFVDEFYAPREERGVRWDDSQFAIAWPAAPQVISERDQNHPTYVRQPRADVQQLGAPR
jgi:dTDP-4-dehydrorhamnose 3,5-epimerase